MGNERASGLGFWIISFRSILGATEYGVRRTRFGLKIGLGYLKSGLHYRSGLRIRDPRFGLFGPIQGSRIEYGSELMCGKWVSERKALLALSSIVLNLIFGGLGQ